jgi:serine/threonine-protein kinase
VATSRIADSVGRVLGDRYRLIRPLGMGASAHVFVAEDVRLRRRVAIKLLHPALAGDEGFLRRFRAEAQVVASLRHPNILTVFDWGEDGGSPYLVMELLEGGSLRSLLDRAAVLSPSQAASVGADAARALDYAHRRGLVHRDIKPANLIFDDEGRVRVADFGLARALAEATWTEPTGAVVGTARYAAPEQVRGENLDSRADVYSLALVLVEATTGIVPFAADTTLGTLMGRIERPLVVSEEAGLLRPILESAGTTDPADRLDAASLAHALDKAGAKLPPPAPLPLSNPLSIGEVERDDSSPTEYPGRPRLFDHALIEAEEKATDGGTPVFDAAAPVEVGARLATASGGPGSSTTGPSPADEPPRDPPRRRRRRLVAILAAIAVLIVGAAVAYASTARLFVPSHPVPSLVGQTEAAARATLQPLHFHLAVSATAYSAQAVGRVIVQVPSRGKLKEGTVVRVTVSRGPKPVPVPSLEGKTVAQATQVLSRLGLKLGSVTPTASMTVPAGQISASAPNTGTIVPGQSVDLTVSSGKPKVQVPSLDRAALASFASAKAALAAMGLGAAEVDGYSDMVGKGQVSGTQPAAGTTVVVGTTVTVNVSKGPHLVVIPSVFGDSVSAAAQLLANYGFSVSGVSGNPTALATGTSPPDGTTLHIGSAVEIVTG